MSKKLKDPPQYVIIVTKHNAALVLGNAMVTKKLTSYDFSDLHITGKYDN